MEFIIVTGLSGAGKSRCIDVLEDIGFYCVDNMPPLLITKFSELLLGAHEQHDKVAIVTDIRGGTNFHAILKSVDSLKQEGCNCKILFIDANDDVLLRRYKETRRRHPLMGENGDSVYDAVKYERELLQPLRERADYVIDTTYLSNAQFKERVTELFLGRGNAGMHITCVSFGFKYGLPTEADLVFDVRCLPNPFYVEELKHLTGLDGSVFDFVMESNETKEYLQKLTDLIDYLIPLYCKEGKSQLMVAIGCTGGKHRSVVFAQNIHNRLLHAGYHSSVHHRDILR